MKTGNYRAAHEYTLKLVSLTRQFSLKLRGPGLPSYTASLRSQNVRHRWQETLATIPSPPDEQLRSMLDALAGRINTGKVDEIRSVFTEVPDDPTSVHQFVLLHLSSEMVRYCSPVDGVIKFIKKLNPLGLDGKLTAEFGVLSRAAEAGNEDRDKWTEPLPKSFIGHVVGCSDKSLRTKLDELNIVVHPEDQFPSRKQKIRLDRDTLISTTIYLPEKRASLFIKWQADRKVAQKSKTGARSE